ncbi:aldo/keto reductase [Altererythrobacter salegens]|uniref:Aldo/keto reductase n=1 Tax=Croceibacterium salegens TaxID=1737568 RepID=A0A6I4SU03_9SPHN|nr:aldo/keto reductase [Croceibacterium salegens]MXO59405.1 aldo/keto reductase [Croceibacterium salegens]
MTANPTLALNDGRTMPQLGFGTWQIDDDKAAEAVRTALDVGYELVDTAAIYGNEVGVGEGLAGADGVFLTTKIWNDDQGFDSAKAAARRSLDKLGRDSVDLLLIHWPCPKKDAFLATWQAMIEMREAGLVKSIGVSNFRIEDLHRLKDETGVIPALNQVELHPRFQQRELCATHEELGVVTQSWSPLGRGGLLNDPAIQAIAAETGQPASAVILRWHLQKGFPTIPKASSRAHMAANFAALSFELDEGQMVRIDALDSADGRIGPVPDDLN